MALNRLIDLDEDASRHADCCTTAAGNFAERINMKQVNLFGYDGWTRIGVAGLRGTASHSLPIRFFHGTPRGKERKKPFEKLVLFEFIFFLDLFINGCVMCSQSRLCVIVGAGGAHLPTERRDARSEMCLESPGRSLVFVDFRRFVGLSSSCRTLIEEGMAIVCPIDRSSRFRRPLMPRLLARHSQRLRVHSHPVGGRHLSAALACLPPACRSSSRRKAMGCPSTRTRSPSTLRAHRLSRSST